MALHFGEIIYVFILGITLYVILKRQLFAPIGQIIQEREDAVESAREFIENAEVKLEKHQTKLETELNDASSSAYEIHEKLREEAFTGRKEIIDEAQGTAYNLLASAREEIRNKSKEVLKQLESDADKYALSIAKILLGKRTI